MSDDAQLGEVLEALEAAGLTEVYINEAGQESMRLTEEGAALAEERDPRARSGLRRRRARRGNERRAPAESLDLTNSWGMGCVNPGKVEHDECAVRVSCSSLTAAEAVNRDLVAARSRQRTLRHDEFNPVEVGGRGESGAGQR